MKRPKGPQMKMPEVKVPSFLADLYYDLRDRRLLPLVALVLVAIVAVPFLLGSDSEEEFEVPADGGIAAVLEAAKARSSKLTVVEATPGLRDYRKRLREREPTDPFEQRYSSASAKGAELNEKPGGGSGSKGETESTSTTDGSSADGGSSPAPQPGGAPPSPAPPSSKPPSGKGDSDGSQLTFYSIAINVRIVKSVDGKQGEPIVRKQVLSQTPLPGEKEPVVTYMGPAREGKKATGKALLLVSNEVTAVAGDAICLSGDEICQLLEVEPGFPVVLTYGDAGVKYTVNVLKFELVVVGRD